MVCVVPTYFRAPRYREEYLWILLKELLEVLEKTEKSGMLLLYTGGRV
jgi:hypothetical protein